MKKSTFKRMADMASKKSTNHVVFARIDNKVAGKRWGNGAIMQKAVAFNSTRVFMLNCGI